MGKEKDERIIDLRRRKIAIELEREMDGLFGIDYHDIERALERYEAKMAPGSSPIEPAKTPPGGVEIASRLLEALRETFASEVAAGRGGEARAIIELYHHYGKKLERELESLPETPG